MKKIKMKKRFGLNHQKSRSIVENVLSGTKARFKAILNLVFNQKKERKKMDNQKSESTYSATLPEVVKQHGDVKDWRNLVGTGPFIFLPGCSISIGSSYFRTYNK